MSTKLFRTITVLLAIALTLMACGRPPAPLAPTATAAPTEAPATAVPTEEPIASLPPPTVEPELLCDWGDHSSYAQAMWPSIARGFSFASIEMAAEPLCATVVKVYVPGRGAFNFFYFRTASGDWFVSPPIEALWGIDSLVYPIGAVSDGKIAWYTFYDLRGNELIEVATNSEAVGLITHAMTVKEAAGLFSEQQPCGLPTEIELVEQVLPQIPDDAKVYWFEWMKYEYNCNAYSTLFVSSSEDTTMQYTWLSDGTTIWGPIEREGNTIPNILRWRNNAVTLFDFVGNIWTVEVSDDGSFAVIEETQYNQVLFGTALGAERNRTSGPGYLEPLAEVFPLESPVKEIDLEGWLPLPGDLQYLIAYYHIGEEWKEVVLFAKGDAVTNPIAFEAAWIHFDWRVELDGDKTIVTSCTAGLTVETGTINTFTIVGDTVTLTQKTGTCR